MSRSHLLAALVGAALVAGGVWIGALAFPASDDGDVAAPVARDVAAPPPVVPEPEVPAPRLGGSARQDGPELEARVALLEAKLLEVEAALSREREDGAPLRDLYRQLLEAGVVGADGTLASHVVESTDIEEGVPGELLAGPALARQLARGLGLDEARTKAFVGEFELVLGVLKELETRHAEATVQGDLTTIRIGRYESEGSDVRRRWEDWVAANLTGEEHDALRTGNATGQLFGNRLGDFERTISIRNAGGNIELTEAAKAPDGNDYEMRIQGPAVARDLVLADYLHLLGR